jgi:hypothetical protein
MEFQWDGRFEARRESRCETLSGTRNAECRRGVSLVTDDAKNTSHGMRRGEVTCRRYGEHLGHVFPDGSTETGLRHCMNTVSLQLDDQNPVMTEKGIAKPDIKIS